MKIVNDNILLFPIDTVSRELEWQLLIALEAKRKFDITSVIGHKGVIKKIHNNSENCIWLGRLPTNHGKSQGDLSIVKKGNDNNTKFLFLHDEGAFYPKRNYDKSVLQTHPLITAELSNNFHFLTWGLEQKNILVNNANKPVEVSTTGMPRFDLFKPEYNWWDESVVNEIKRKQGSFSLIITKFGNANSSEHGSGLISEKFLKANKIINEPKRVKEYFKRWEQDHIDFSGYVVMLQEVFEAFPDRKFIIRPHPSENSEFYEHVFGYLENVRVIREGDVRPWIKACEAMIHTGCTTGVEGSIAGKKVINYVPNKASSYSISIADEAGVLARDSQEVIGLLNHNHLSNSAFSEEALNRLQNLTEMSVEKVIDLVKKQTENNDHSIVQLDSQLLRSVKWLKSKSIDYKNAKSRGVKSGDFGRSIRLSEIPKETVQSKITAYNNKYKTSFEAKVVDKNIVVI